MIIALQTLIFFRQSLLTALDRFLRPYYKKFTLTFNRHNNDSDDEETEEQVFAEFDDEKGVVFYPPVYAQRYAAVSDCLMDERWCGKLQKVVDLGYHDMSFIKYLKEVPGIRCILGVDIESIALRCSSELLGCEEYGAKRDNPLQVTLFQGNAADPDYRLIGCDAVVAIEMIEHMLPQDLDRLVHTVFGFIKPWIVIFTTPNGDFNPLFKSMEKNGLRRWDHFFEWTREQFHDWCSNIVVRYPHFSVTCKGIGPGPTGTLHYGCCSQLALFVSKDYHKQQDLNLNSLALVANVPSPQNITDFMGEWESPEPVSENVIFPPNNAESLTEFLYSEKQSCVTIVIRSPTFSIDTLRYHDKTSQCNMETERGRNFLMFDDEDMCFSILVPRRKMVNKVYEIEDVNSRLNCSTFQVTKFSKISQDLIARNKSDSLVHTREVVNEIRNLTRMLNFNKNSPAQNENGTHTWCNINWGQNAPYWNQYYKVVRDYNYPFETKSEECRIIDLISDEVNRLIDNQCDEEFSVDVNKLEIPIDHLMNVVCHITDDVDKVKDLLEWNGYEIVGDVVIHSRLVVDNSSVPSNEDEWVENDTISDWDTTDVHSTTLSDGSTIVPDYHGRCLRRALDKKVRKLRTMLSADEDITMELDRVVCRLMKLALRSSKGKQTPPPARWMQCKLLDMLTLTEKAIQRRKRHFIDSFPLNSIGFGQEECEELALSKVKRDDVTTLEIVDKYKCLIQLSEKHNNNLSMDFGLSDELIDEDDVTSSELLKDSESDDIRDIPQLMPTESVLKEIPFGPKATINNESNIYRTQAWVEEDANLALVLLPSLDNKSGIVSSSDHTSNGARYRYYKKPCKKSNAYSKHTEVLGKKTSRKSRSKLDKHPKAKQECKISKTNVMTKTGNKAGCNFVKSYGKNIVTFEHDSCAPKSRRKIREHKINKSTASKPIPGSLIELCHPELSLQKNKKDVPCTVNETPDINVNHFVDNVAATEETLLVDIVMDDMEETIALRRTIGTDANEQDTILGAVANITKYDRFYYKPETTTETVHVHSQTIFLNDINEPSTSKGVRHVSMDAQCGPDPATPYSKLSSPPSPTRMPKIFTAGIKIGDSLTDIADKMHHSNFGTSTNDNIKNFQPLRPRSTMSNIFRPGIKIGDSTSNIIENKGKNDFGISAGANVKNFGPVCHSINHPKVFSTGIKNNDSLENVTTWTNSFDFGTSIDEVDFSPLSPRIKSFCDVQTKESLDFGTSTNNVCQTKINSSQNFREVIPTQENDGYSSVSSRTESPKVTHMIEISDSFTKALMKKNCEFGTCTDDYNKSFKSSRLKSPKMAARINIDDSLTGVKSSKTSKFATSTDSEKTKFKTLTTIKKSDCIRFKDSDTNTSTKVEFASMKRVEEVTDVQTSNNVKSETETKLLKPISSAMRIEDSGSEFYGSCASPLHFMNPSTNLSDFQFKKSISKNVGVEEYPSINRIRRKLSCGGVHVHSYKEKQYSEDVVYQGHWQRHRIKSHIKKKVYHPAIVKKVESAMPNGTNNLKEKKPSCSYKPLQRKVEAKSKQIKAQIRYPKPVKVKHDIVLKVDPAKKKIGLPCCLTKATRTNKNIGMIASKTGMSFNSSKGVRGSRVLKIPSLLQPPAVLVNKDGDKLAKYTMNSYVPSYLKKRNYVINANNLNKSSIPVKTVIKGNKDKPKEKVPASGTSILAEVKNSLTKFLDQPLENIQYLVFRNEIENNNKTSTDCQPTGSTKDNTNRKNRCSSPVSQTSSACSTPDSIATVRELSKAFTRRHSTSSNKSSLGNTDTETIPSTKNRKYTKRGKNTKKSDDKDHDNKENYPESSKKHVSNLNSLKNDKSAFKGRSKSVFIAQFATDSSPTVNNISKHKTQVPNKSNIKMPVVEVKDENKRPGTASISKKITIKSNESLKNDKDNISADMSNMIFVLEPQEPDHIKHENVISPQTTFENDPAVTKSLDNCVMDWLGDPGIAMKSTESIILAGMRQIVEDRLNFVDDSAISYETFDFDIFNSSGKNDNQDLIAKSSLTSFNTLIKNDISLESCTENGLNRSFDTTLGDESIISLGYKSPTVTDTDLLSFKSITSASKFSDYFSADNTQELPTTSFHAPKESSVHDIFERKEQPRIQIPAGALAYQAFSGFSMNAEPVAGDQPDYVNLIDSETGSLALEIARHAASEELFVSGRSSASYESCVLDEDVVVPNWLFDIINQQQSLVAAEEGELPQHLVQMPMPHGDPLFDVNGNVAEPGFGVGAGAGDGRGMHSDHSQDSSGRGTSLSSSDTSSGPHSEGILIDPLTFTGQFELLRERIDSSLAVTTLVTSGEVPDVTGRAAEGERIEANAASTSRDLPVRLAPNLLFTSDVDADVSSLDTDVPDFSDN